MTARANAEVASVAMKLTTARLEHLLERIAEAERECALLWLTFSLLDRVVAGTFTLPWGIWNTLGTLVIWSMGTYIELRAR